MKNLFNSIELFKPKSNVFDLTHDVKLSANMGELVPILCQEAVPGDKFQLAGESLIRFAPLVSPVMHRMDVTLHYFFVPNRILWPNWEKFITNTRDEMGLLPAFPYVKVGGENFFSRLHDYIGLPTPPIGGGTEERVSALPLAAYQKIYDEYYRDQNLIESELVPLPDGDCTGQAWLATLRRRAWEHDYFTSALPWAQKGESVDIPLGKVILDGDQTGTKPVWRPSADHTQSIDGGGDFKTDIDGHPEINDGIADVPAVYDPNGTLITDPTTINDLRRAFKLQEWLERNARGGTRYIENILAHFGVRSSDKRLQRPEYICGSKSPVVISEVLNTTGTEELPQGNMAGHGVAVNSGKFGKYFCEEHGFIVGIMSIMPKTAYQQGIPKQFLKIDDPTQYYWPSFAHIGEQEILNKEIMAYQAAGGENTFGYTPRYSEYKFAQSRVSGDFRDSLDFWHLGRIFDVAPNLNENFVTCFPTHRVFAVTDEAEQKMYCHVLNKVKAVRPMPKFGSPSF